MIVIMKKTVEVTYVPNQTSGATNKFMIRIWSQSTGSARQAIILGGLAQLTFLLPFILVVFVPLWDRGGLYFLMFWPIAILFALWATGKSFKASRESQWWRPDGGKRFVCTLYGLPIALLALVVGLLR